MAINRVGNFDISMARGGVEAAKAALNSLNSEDDDTSAAKRKELKSSV